MKVAFLAVIVVVLGLQGPPVKAQLEIVTNIVSGLLGGLLGGGGPAGAILGPNGLVGSLLNTVLTTAVSAADPILNVVKGLLQTVLKIVTDLLGQLLNLAKLQNLLPAELLNAKILEVSIDASQLLNAVTSALDLSKLGNIELKAKVKVKLADSTLIDCALDVKTSLNFKEIIDLKLTCPAPIGTVSLPSLSTVTAAVRTLPGVPATP
jgi:hypothetical protein